MPISRELTFISALQGYTVSNARDDLCAVLRVMDLVEAVGAEFDRVSVLNKIRQRVVAGDLDFEQPRQIVPRNASISLSAVDQAGS